MEERQDLINRAEASDALMAWEESSVWNEECLKHRGEPFWIAPSDVINQLPHAQRKKGKWTRWYEVIEDDTGIEYIPHCKCSECGTEYDPHTVKFIKFCSYCGADMREGEADG